MYEVENKGVIITLHKVQNKEIVVLYTKFKIKVSDYFALSENKEIVLPFYEIQNKGVVLLRMSCFVH